MNVLVVCSIHSVKGSETIAYSGIYKCLECHILTIMFCSKVKCDDHVVSALIFQFPC